MKTTGHRRIWGLSLVFLLTLVAAACAPTAAPTPPTPISTAVKPPPAAATPTAAPAKPTQAAPTPTPKPVTLKFGTTGSMSYVGIYIAMAKGFFKEQGINVEVINIRSVAELVAPLGTGQLDFVGMPVSTALLAAVDRGIELKVVADGGQQRANWGSSWMILRKDLADSGQVKTPADLKGMKIGIASQGSYLDMFARLVLEEGRLKPEDAELVVVPHADQPPALANKAIAAGTTVEPFVSIAVQQGVAVRWRPDYQYFDGNSQSTFVIFGPELLKDKDVARRWMIAYLKGARVFLDAFEKNIGREEVINILINQTTVKDRKMYDLMGIAYPEPNGNLDRKSLGKQYKWYVDNGIYTGKLTFDDLVDPSFAEYATQQLGKR